MKDFKKIATTTDPKVIRQFSKIGLNDYLFHPFGNMQYWFASPEMIEVIAIAYVNGVPTGSTVILKKRCPSSHANIGTFVKDGYRRKGIGAELVERARARVPNKMIHAWVGYHPADWLYRGKIKGKVSYVS